MCSISPTQISAFDDISLKLVSVQCLLKYNNLDALVHDLVHDLVACMQGYTKNS